MRASLRSEVVTDDENVTLPDPVLARVLSLTSAVLGALDANDVPASLRRIARFTPAKRARLGAQAIVAALESDAEFRARIAAADAAVTAAGVGGDDGDALDRLGTASPAGPAAGEVTGCSAAGGVDMGVGPADMDPPDAARRDHGADTGANAMAVTRAARAYLLRHEGWRETVAAAGRVLSTRADDARAEQEVAAVLRLERALVRTRESARRQVDQSAEELRAIRSDADQLRKRVRILTGDARRAQRTLGAVEAELAAEREQAAAARAEATATVRRLRSQLSELQQQASTTRRSGRAAREADSARLRVLLDTIAAAAAGLREEMALPPGQQLPADGVVRGRDGARAAGSGIDDTGALDRVLALPRAHLIVDGYNVTKTGYAGLPLAAQRDRLLAGLGAVTARTGVELTCVFDGSAAPVVAAPAPRGVRLIFSDPDQIADDVIRALVAAEPAGRVVVVVSSDREVAEAARRAGFYAATARVLLDRLARG